MNGLLLRLISIFLFALTIYATATILWILALKRVELSVAYPFMALAFFIVPIAGFLFLGESLTIKTFLGAALIIAGLIISVR
jgi:drug/metabolite transporter (DMT)-like permease